MSKLPEFIELPPFVDVHVHLREPSINKSETIYSGTYAALLGGYGLIADMPNNPGNPTWTEAAMREKHAIAEDKANIPVGFYAGWQPDSEAEIPELVKMAPLAVGLKLYGAPTTGNDRDYTAEDFLPAVRAWAEAAPDKPIMFHAGQDNLSAMIDLVARRYDLHLHVCHVNDRDQVFKVEQAKRQNLPVTCGVCPHHLLKSSHDVHSEGWFARMQPPLAEQTESEELMRLLSKGQIDIIETDHAPHTEATKFKAEEENPDGVHDPDHATCFGVPGIEFAAPLMFYQVKRGRISMERLVDAMSTKPAQILGTITNNSAVSWRMDEYRIEDESRATVASYAGWTPYLGKLAVGEVDSVLLGGRLIYYDQIQRDKYSRVITHRGGEI